LIAEQEQVEHIVEEEENYVAWEQHRQQQLQQEQRQQQQLLQHQQPLQHQQQPMQQQDQHQLLHQSQQVAVEFLQSPSTPQCTWIPVTVQLIPAMSPVCDEHVQQVLQVQWADQPTAVELPHVPLQAWMQQQQQQQQHQWQQEQQQQEQQQQQQQQLQMQLPLQQMQPLSQFDACTGQSCGPEVGTSQWSSSQQVEAAESLGVPQDLCQDEASSVVSSNHIDLLIESLNGDHEAKQHALACLRGSVVRHAFNAQGCRAVQFAFQVADTWVAAELLAELSCHVPAATCSPHANYVIQKAIDVMPPAACVFIVREIRGTGVAVARHRYGCRVICRLLEHMADISDCAELIEEVLAQACYLSRHEFGHYVMQSVLEHGKARHRGCLYQSIISDLRRLAGHSCSSYVVEKALTHGSGDEQQSIGEALLALGLDSMVSLALTQSGSFVTKALLQTGTDAARVATEQLCHAEARLKRNKYGRRVLDDALQQAEKAA